jgi:hypothetical protein
VLQDVIRRVGMEDRDMGTGKPLEQTDRVQRQPREPGQEGRHRCKLPIGQL